MDKSLTRYLLLVLVLIVCSAGTTTAAAMEPAPADRGRHQFKREPGEFKWTSSGMVDPSPDVISLEHLPVDDYGFVDWSRALREGVIAPRAALPDQQPGEDSQLPARDIIIRSKMAFMPDVLFPHDSHSAWLKCSNCHPKIFARKAGGNDITMAGIWKGEFCGRCHDRVAFPTRNCFKCHSVPRNTAAGGTGGR